jgi:hypothetical protein
VVVVGLARTPITLAAGHFPTKLCGAEGVKEQNTSQCAVCIAADTNGTCETCQKSAI